MDTREKIFVVSLKGLAPWISKVRYEKKEKDLVFYFTLNNGELSSENLSLQVRSSPDLTLIVGDKPQQNKERFSRQDESLARLLRVALREREYLASQDTHVSVLRQLDFTAAGTTPKLLPRLFPLLKHSLGERSSYLVLFESRQTIEGLGWIVRESLLQDIVRRSRAQQKGNWLILQSDHHSFEQAKHALLS